MVALQYLGAGYRHTERPGLVGIHRRSTVRVELKFGTSLVIKSTMLVSTRFKSGLDGIDSVRTILLPG
jgi:hypothetical protein